MSPGYAYRIKRGKIELVRERLEKISLTVEFYARRYVATISIILAILAMLAIILVLQQSAMEAVEPSNTGIMDRNRFDACVIDWLVNNTYNTQSWDYYRNSAEASCVKLLR